VDNTSAQFISRITTLKARDQAQTRSVFSERHVCVTFPRIHSGVFALSISCRRLDWQLSSLVQICISSFPQALTPTVDHLCIFENSDSQPHWLDDIENSQWSEILRSFTTVKNLYLSKELARCVVPSLQELIGGQETGSLPAVQSLFLEELHPSGLIEEAIGRFVTARLSSNHPIAIYPWKRGRPSLWVFGAPEVYSLSVFFRMISTLYAIQLRLASFVPSAFFLIIQRFGHRDVSHSFSFSSTKSCSSDRYLSTSDAARTLV
jgi:hypothetical protein